ncbi:MAG: hypothetical protein C0409_03320 [Novosphingobium sp.]|nr:hypothetical protein [Novosphingobium sp.]
MQATPVPDAAGQRLREGVSRLCLAIVAVALFGALLFCMVKRGPWYDEFYTWYVTDTRFGLRDAFAHHWLADNHPPLFYMLVRAARMVWTNIEGLRLVNGVIGVIAFTCAGLSLRGDRRMAAPGLIAFLFIASQRATLLYGSELRSYFLSLCATALLVLGLTALYRNGTPGNRASRFMLAGAIVLSFNIHIVTTLVSGAIIVPFLAAWLVQRKFAAFRAVLIPAIVSGLLFVGVTAVQLPLWEANTRSFWITPGFTAGWLTIRITAQRVIEANAVIAILGTIGLVASVAQWLRRRERNADLEAAVLLGVGGLLSVGALLAIHCWRPVLIEKYLSCLIPVVAMALAIGMDQVLRQAPAKAAAALMMIATAASLYAMNTARIETAAAKSWEGTATTLGNIVRHCPDTAVHIDPHWNDEVVRTPPRDNVAVVSAAYHLMAQRHGFTIEPAASRRVPAHCPTVFWAEHDTRRLHDVSRILAHEQQMGFAVNQISQMRIGDGWLAISTPAP